jgi:hypothetical protein
VEATGDDFVVLARLIVFFTSDLIVLFHFGLFPLGLFEQLFVGVRLLEFSFGLLCVIFCLRGGDRENFFLSSHV